jgi:asparagine N-glycosylation enzyme membrane subunit Stt3
VDARRWLALGAVLAIATWARLIPSPQVFTPEGTRLGPDGDPYYHLYRAERLALHGELVWFDPGLDYPRGAEVLWPPGFDALIAGAAWVAAPGGPTAATVAQVAAWLPVALGLLTVLLVALLAAEVASPWAGVAAALLLALLPGNLQFTTVGRADQHALEALLLVALLLFQVRALRAAEAGALRRRTLAAGAVLALAFWSWPGSALLLGVLAAGAGAWHVLARDDEARARGAAALALTAGAAAGLLLVSIALLGPPGALREGRISGVSALPVALCAATAAAAALLAWLARRPGPWWRRPLEALAAGLLAVAAVAAVPALRPGIEHGLRALGRANPWYQTIDEYLSFLDASAPPSVQLTGISLVFGLTPLAALLAIPALRARLRTWPDQGAGVALVATSVILLFGLALARARLQLYAAPLLAVLAAVGIAWATRRLAELGPRLGLPAGPGVAGGSRAAAGLALLTLVLWPLATPLRALGADLDPGRRLAIRMAQRLRTFASGQAGGGGLLGPWDRGHHLRYFSGVPVVTTPFGTDLAPDALDDASRFFTCATGEEAEAVLARRQVRWVLVDRVEEQVSLAAALLPDRAVPARREQDHPGGALLTDAADDLVPFRLLKEDGIGGVRGPPLDGFRLMDEDAASPEDPPSKLYEVVRGAILQVSGATPGAVVRATTQVSAPGGRTFQFELRALADEAGRAELRAPYSTGANGRALATPWVVGDGRGTAVVAVEEPVVRAGVGVPVRLR